MATGWLGWTPEVALDTPLSQLALAIDGKLDFLRKTNPFRTKEDVERDEREERARYGGDPLEAANALVAFVNGRLAEQQEKKGRRKRG